MATRVWVEADDPWTGERDAEDKRLWDALETRPDGLAASNVGYAAGIEPGRVWDAIARNMHYGEVEEVTVSTTDDTGKVRTGLRIRLAYSEEVEAPKAESPKAESPVEVAETPVDPLRERLLTLMPMMNRDLMKRFDSKKRADAKAALLLLQRTGVVQQDSCGVWSAVEA